MDNGLKAQKIESTLPRYLEFRTFELFRDRLYRIVSPHCREGSKEDLYSHLFLCPAQVGKKRNFQLNGVLSPFVCMWRTSLLVFADKDYSRSVLPYDFVYYDKEGNKQSEVGYLYDVSFTVDIFSSSYYKSFRDRVNMDLLDLDRLRYFEVDVKELLKDCAMMMTKAEFRLKGMNASDNVEGQRSFDLTASYDVHMTIPYARSFEYLTGIELYLNENLIYERNLADEGSAG